MNKKRHKLGEFLDGKMSKTFLSQRIILKSPFRTHAELWDLLFKEMNKIYDVNPKLDISSIEEVKGWKKTDDKHYRYGDGYAFSNGNGCKCNVYFKGKKEKRKMLLSIAIDDISSSVWKGTVGSLYCCMDNIDEIASEFRKFKGELDKQEKIEQISQNSITTWLKAIFKNQPYSYYTTESDNKITLSVKLKKGMQLDIPIYYKTFQKIMPELLNSIQQFEKIASGYAYKIEEMKNKTLMTVRISGKQQLEIPIYHKSFQSIVPYVLETIQQYEEFAKKQKIRASLNNLSSDSKNWSK